MEQVTTIKPVPSNAEHAQAAQIPAIVATVSMNKEALASMAFWCGAEKIKALFIVIRAAVVRLESVAQLPAEPLTQPDKLSQSTPNHLDVGRWCESITSSDHEDFEYLLALHAVLIQRVPKQVLSDALESE